VAIAAKLTAASSPEAEIRAAADPLPASELAALAADSRTVAAWTLLSRVSGFGRVAAMAGVLGPTYVGNLFQTANLLPNIIHELLTGSLIAAMLVPPLVRCADGHDQDGVRQLANGFLGVLLLAFTVVIALSMLGGSLLLELITLAVDDAAVREQQHRVGWVLLAVFMPQLLFYGIASTAVAVQQARRRFALSAAAPALENLGIIAVMLAAALIFGVGADADEVTTAQLLFLGIGCTAAVAAHAAAQWWGAYRVGVPLWPRAGWRDPEVRRIIRLAIASSGYTALNGSIYFGLLVVAGGVPGGAVAVQIGFNFFYLPIALGARPVVAAVLPRLSRSFTRGELAGFESVYRSSLALTCFIALPAALLLFAMPETLARAVSFGEMATVAGVALVAAAIGSLALGIIGEAAFLISTSASYARQDAVAPLVAMALRGVVAFAGMTIAFVAVDGIAVLWVLGLSCSAAMLVSAAWLHACQARALPAPVASGGWRLGGDVGAAVAALAPGLLVAHGLGSMDGFGAGSIAVAGAAAGASGLAYLLIQWLRGSPELGSLLGRFGHARASSAGARRPGRDAAASGAGVMR
jgi:putative peptidoglycan lipid II flippase